MQSISAKATPISASERILALDVTRGLAVLGILLMNVIGMGLPFAAYANPAYAGAPSQPDYLAWFITNTFFEGSMRTLFSMLFGAGFLVILQRLEAKGYGLGGAKIYLRRTCLLIALGLFNALVLVWGGDILFTYGICGAFLLVFYQSKIRGLVVWSLIFMAAMTLFNLGGMDHFSAEHKKYEAAVALQKSGQKLSPEQSKVLESYPEEVSFWTPTEKDLKETVEKHKDWASLSSANLDSNYGEPLNFFLMFYVFDALFGMLLGMIAFRIGLLQGAWSLPAILWLTGLSLAAALPIRLWQTLTLVQGGYSIESFFLTQLTYHLGRAPLALFWLGVALLIARLPWLAWIRFTLARVGRMALTNYLLHSALAAGFFIGLHQFNRLGRAELYLFVAAAWAMNIVLSLLWLQFFRMGPLEWLWRAGSYGRWFPLLRGHRGDTEAVA